MAAEDSERSGTCHARLPWRPGDICPSAYWERHRYGIPSRQTPLSGSSIIRTASRIWMRTCRTPVCKADSPPIWKVPSNRLSGYSTWKRTAPIRRKRLSPGGCNVKRRRNAAHGEYPNYRIYQH